MGSRIGNISGRGDLRHLLAWAGLGVVALAMLVGLLGFTPNMWVQDALLVILTASVFALRHDIFSAVLLVVFSQVIDWYLLVPMPHSIYFTALLGGLALLALVFIAERKHTPWRTLRPVDLVLWGLFLLLGVAAIPRGYGIPVAPKLLLITSAQYVLYIFVSAFVFWLLGTVIVREPTHLRQLFSLLAAFGAILGIHASLQEAGVFLLLTPQMAHFLALPWVNHYYLAGTHTARATSFFVGPDVAESFFSSVALLPLGLLVSSRTWATRMLYGAELLATLAGLLFTYGPVGWGVFAICLVIFLPFGLRGRARAYCLGALGIVAVAGIVVLPHVVGRIINRALSPHELGTRVEIWHSSLNAILANPLLGLGLGEGAVWEDRIAHYLVPGLQNHYSHSQNSFLELAAMAGVPVLVAILLLLGVGLYRAVRIYQLADWSLRPVILSGILTVVALCLNGTSDATWTANNLVPLGWLILGAIASPQLARSLRRTDASPERVFYPVRYGPTSAQPVSASPVSARTHVEAQTETLAEVALDSLASGPIPAVQIGLPVTTSPHLEVVRAGHQSAEEPTAPAPGTAHTPAAAPATNSSYIATLRKTLSNTGLYTIASFAGPLISLILTPYLTHHLLQSDYGILTILTTSITLLAAITQFGMGASFFRVYNYEWDEGQDRRGVLSTVIAMVAIQTVPCAVLVMLFASSISRALLHRADLGSAVVVTAAVIIVQNFTVPGLSWLRGESRGSLYLVLSLSSLVANLVATILLVGVLNLGLLGALYAAGAGYALIAVVTLPVMIARAGVRINRQAAWSLITYGAPQVLSLMSAWVLQVSDRYLLGIMTTYSVVASYSVAYVLGGTVATLVIAPFQLAWPPALYSVAKRADAPLIYRTVFRYLSPILLYAAFGLGVFGKIVLSLLFPKSYSAAAPVIPVVAESLALYGCYNYFMNGVLIRRTIWMAAVFMGAAALINFGCNLVLIPHYGAIGAAYSTLIGYAMLALVGFLANQRIYPVPYEMGRFLWILLSGIAIFVASSYLADHASAHWSWVIAGASLVVYAVVILVATLRRQDVGRIRTFVARRPVPALG